MSLNPTLDTIIFDLGGVLIDWNPEYLYRKIFTDEAEMRYFLKEVATPHWNEEQDGGRPIAEATEMLIKEHPKYEAEIRAFYGRWTEMLGGVIPETLEILETLLEKGEHRIYALTNWSHETFPIALERYAFLKRFHGVLVSGVEKLKKPDPKIYQLILSRYNIDPQQALFIDDNLRNVHAAEALGIHAIHFRSPQQLKQYLMMSNVL
jgi:2-haloacid dehalogenase